MKEWRDNYQGERIFLIGNGPSLAETPLHLLSEEYTFAVNKVHKIYNKTSWRPSFYFNALPDHFGKEFVKGIEKHAKIGVPCFIPERAVSRVGTTDEINTFKFINADDEIWSYDERELKDLPINQLEAYWSFDASKRIFACHSMYTMMQIINYMGFDEIFLVGCDLGYGSSKPHMLFDSGLDPYDLIIEGNHSKISFLLASIDEGTPIRTLANGASLYLLKSKLRKPYANILISANMVDYKDHFTSDYEDPTSRIKPGYQKDLEHRKSHIVARRILSENGVNVYNATVGGELEVYPRVELENLLN